jgi:hypothetical protein
VLSLWGALSHERSGLSPVNRCRQYLVHCEKCNIIYIVYVIYFMNMQYILGFCQHRLRTADHTKQQSRHLNEPNRNHRSPIFLRVVSIPSPKCIGCSDDSQNFPLPTNFSFIKQFSNPSGPKAYNSGARLPPPTLKS